MKPFEQFPPSLKKEIKYVLTDIDDTLTTAGKLTAEAYTALERLSRAGLLCVPITGRPAGALPEPGQQSDQRQQDQPPWSNEMQSFQQAHAATIPRRMPGRMVTTAALSASAKARLNGQ